jgi:thymidylate kinase
MPATGKRCVTHASTWLANWAAGKELASAGRLPGNGGRAARAARFATHEATEAARRKGPRLLITFSGLDGAGKSTLIEWLKATLQAEERRVVVLHMNTHVGLHAYARFLLVWVMRSSRGNNGARPGVGAHRAAPSSEARGVTGALRRIRTEILWSRLFREVTYPVDLLLFFAYRLYIEKLRKRILIMDRYFYDWLADMADGRRWTSLRLLQALTPTPDVAFLLDVTPEQADHRKPEQPFAFLERRWQAYNVLFPWVRNSVILSNHDLDTAKATLYGVVTERLRSP